MSLTGAHTLVLSSGGTRMQGTLSLATPTVTLSGTIDVPVCGVFR